MTGEAGQTFGLIGPLAAFPLRMIARVAERRGHRVHRGIRRGTAQLVIGRRLLADDRTAERRLNEALAAGRPVLSEAGFLRELELLEPASGRTVDTRALLSQSHLAEPDLDVLRLFDAFEADREPFTFRDLILARKYAGLIADGASAIDIARSVHRSGSIASLTSKTLHADRKGSVYASFEEGVGDLTGQLLFDLGGTEEEGEEELFAQAEALEDAGQHLAAAELYRRCLAADPRDGVAAFNRANCLSAAGRPDEATNDYLRALKIDPSFAEAWFNLANLKADQDQARDARRCLQKALAVDPDYADAIYNLARLEFEADNLDEARRLWRAYLKFDSTSDWAKTAMRGIQYADFHAAQRSAG